MKQKWLTSARIVGIILIAIGVLTFFIQKRGISFGIAGIILLIAPTKHGQSMLDKCTAAFSKWKTIIITALYDAIYYLLLFGGVYLFYWQLQVRAASNQLKTPLVPGGMMKPELAIQDAAATQEMAAFILVGALVLLIFSFFIYSLSRGIIWATITNQKATKKFLTRFTSLNSLWWLIWLPIFFLINISLGGTQTAQTATLGLLAIAAYFTVIMHTLYMKTKKIGYSIGNGIGFGFSKIHKLIVPYTFAFVIYIILYQIFRIFQYTQFLNPVAMLFVVLFIAWLRTYLYDIIKTFE